MSQPDPLSLTLAFKKHKTTVLLMLPPTTTIPSAKDSLLQALKSRELKEINGDSIPDDPAAIELGAPVDRNDLDKGWISLESDGLQLDDGDSKKSSGPLTLQAAEIKSGQPVAFRFRNNETNKQGDGLGLEDPGWDVVLPSLDDEEDGGEGEGEEEQS